MSDPVREAVTPRLETFEWDEVWWEHTENRTSKRILYVGDSISCGVRRLITRLSNETVLCDGFGTSKAVDNPFLIPSIRLCIQQQGKCDGILFNNGLHGGHLSPEEYEKHLEKLLLFLLETKKPVYVLLSTTDIANPARSARIPVRNAIAEKLAKKHGLPVLDLYTVALENENLHSPDGVHFTAEGYERMAAYILEAIDTINT